MEDNMKKNGNELQNDQENEVIDEIPEKSEAQESPNPPKKPPLNPKTIIVMAAGALVLIAIIVAIVLLAGTGDGGHVCAFGEWTTIADATCTEAGSRERVCTCGEKETETIAALGHDWKAATCQTPKTCKRCYLTEGSVAAHAFTEELALAEALKSEASCSSAAVYYKSCICGRISESDSDTFTTGSKDAHSYTLASSTEASCENQATETYVCACGDTYTNIIGEALGHSIDGVTPVEKPIGDSGCEFVLVYTCTAEGCGQEVEGEHVYYHNYIASITKSPTCKDDGVKTLTCQCGDSYTESIPKNSTGHKWITGELVGNLRTDTCEYCSESKKVTVFEGTTTDSLDSESLKDTEIELNDANISLGDGVVDAIGDKSVTISADKLNENDKNGLLSPEQLAQVGNSPIYNFTINDGTNNISQFGDGNYVTITLPYTLSEGEDVDSIAIWFIDNNGELESIKATYNNGYVTFMTNHFSYYTVTRLTPAERCALYGHNYAEQTFEGSCTANGYTIKVCVRCHKSEKVITSIAQGHNYETEVHEATCTENGYTIYSCKSCGYSYTKTDTAIGHLWESGERKESTCSENGYQNYKCSKCGEEYTESLPKKEHQMVSEEIIKAPTCIEDGYKLISCVCGETVRVDIPATNIHNYENGVCTVCGQTSNAAVKLDGIVIQINNFTYSMTEKDDDKWSLTGKIEKVDLTELMLYVEDGELCGAAIGSVDYYTRFDGESRTYALTAIIDDGFVYYNIDAASGNSKQNINGKLSIKDLLAEAIEIDNDTSSSIVSFINDSLIPAIEAIASNNSETIDKVVGDALDIIFTTKTEADGSKTISLDKDKIKALNERLVTLSIAEVIDYYFGEGCVDGIYDSAIEILNTVITDIPDLIKEQGVDLDAIIEEIEALLPAIGVPVDVNIRDFIYNEEFSEITIGMLVFGTEDNSYEEDVDEFFDIIREKTLYDILYDLGAIDDPDDAKSFIDGIIEDYAGKIGLSFYINAAGQLVDIDVNVSEITVENEDTSHFIDASVGISFTGRIDVTWGDIIDRVNGNIYLPDEEELDKEPITGGYLMSGNMLYKGIQYSYRGQTGWKYTPDYSQILNFVSISNCGDWRQLQYQFAAIGYEASLRRLYDENGNTVYTLFVDEITNEIVELVMNENGAVAIFEDGSEKNLTSDDLDADLYHLYATLFGDNVQNKLNRYADIGFYYNPVTKETAESSQHDYTTEYTLHGDSCEDGVTKTITCSICGMVEITNHNYHTTDYEEIDLTEYGACYGTIDIRCCPCGEIFDIYLGNSCGNYNSNQYYDEYGRLVYVVSSSCTNCGLRAQHSYYTVQNADSCQAKRYHTITVSINDNLVLNKEYVNSFVSHDYTVSGHLAEGATSCYDGVIITYTCKHCGDSYTENLSYHREYTKEKIDLASLGSLCGGYAEITGCACGEYINVRIDNSLCDFNTRYCEIWIDDALDERQYNTNGYDWFDYSAIIYVCAVTDPDACPFKIRYADYWIAEGSCLATNYEVWQFGYNEQTGEYEREVKITKGRRQYHNYETIELDNGTKYLCYDCGSYYSEMIYQYDQNLIRNEIIAENYIGTGNRYYEEIFDHKYDENDRLISESLYRKTIDENGNVSESTYEYIYINGYQYTVYDYYYDHDYWYKYEYTYDFTNGCNRTCVYTNSYGERRESTENCCVFSYDTITSPTCSQEGIRGEYCLVCGITYETHPIKPNDHCWVYLSDNHYYCSECGLENENGISGNVILEDLSEQYGNGENYVVGYYMYNNLQFTYYVSIYLPNGEEIILNGVEFTEGNYPRAIYFSKAEVEAAIIAAGYSTDDGDVRFAFVPYGSDGSFDYAITFTDDEVYDYIVNDASFLCYVDNGEIINFTICPTESGNWIFTSLSDGDTYATIYDSEGNYIYSNDDDGDGSNFYIEYYLNAGESYILSVKWYSESSSGYMPLIFSFEG